jgi:hypothetical protein
VSSATLSLTSVDVLIDFYDITFCSTFVLSAIGERFAAHCVANVIN